MPLKKDQNYYAWRRTPEGKADFQAKRRARRRKRAQEAINNVAKPRNEKLEESQASARLFRVHFNQQWIERVNPEKAAAAIDLVMNEVPDRFRKMKRMAEEVGLPPGVLKGLIQRMEARYKPLTDEMRQINNKGILSLLEDKISRALHYMDDYAMSGSTAKDLAVILGILIEKRQLLKGEPTAILTTEERLSLTELLPQIVKEAARRGYTIDLPKTDYEQVRMVGERTRPGVDLPSLAVANIAEHG